jgi:EAL domain-containing protein (putative c-di-GMP-specific phosphodiesterase class I)
VERLSALAIFGSLLGVLLGPGLDARHRGTEAQAQVMATLKEAAFSSLFQPIVDLGTGRVAGHEALTRFSGHQGPALAFAAAARAGLGVELETATLVGAVLSAEGLPADAFLSLNVSPEFIASGQVARILAGGSRPIVLEITEHVPIVDYASLRATLSTLGPRVRLAVDDAGAGFASFRHILELSPAFVKLDIGLVRGIDADPARQALVAGMVFFAAERQLSLIAEGIETAAELDTVRRLGVPLGQGFFLGRPRADGDHEWDRCQGEPPGDESNRDQFRSERAHAESSCNSPRMALRHVGRAIAGARLVDPDRQAARSRHPRELSRPRSSQLPPEPDAPCQRRDGRHERPRREHQQRDSHDLLHITGGHQSDARPEAAGEGLGAVGQPGKRGGVAHKGVPVGRQAVGDEGELGVEAGHAGRDTADRVRGRRQWRRSEERDRAELRLECGQVGPHLGRSLRRGRHSLRRLVGRPAKGAGGRGCASKHRCGELDGGRQAGSRGLGVAANGSDTAVHPDRRPEPDARDEEPHDAVGDQPAAQPPHVRCSDQDQALRRTVRVLEATA